MACFSSPQEQLRLLLRAWFFCGRTEIAVLQDQEYPEADNRIPSKEHTVRFRKEGYRRHTFQGANVYLMELFRQFNDVLGVRLKDYETGVEGIHFASTTMCTTPGETRPRSNSPTSRLWGGDCSRREGDQAHRAPAAERCRVSSAVDRITFVRQHDRPRSDHLGIGADEWSRRDCGGRRQGAAERVF